MLRIRTSLFLFELVKVAPSRVRDGKVANRQVSRQCVELAEQAGFLERLQLALVGRVVAGQAEMQETNSAADIDREKYAHLGLLMVRPHDLTDELLLLAAKLSVWRGRSSLLRARSRLYRSTTGVIRL